MDFTQPVIEFSQFWLTHHLLDRYLRFGRQVRGTVGAGDATIGGFLAGMLRGFSLAECCRMACAVGATSVEGAEAANAIPTWDTLRERVQQGHCVSAAQSLSCVSVFSYTLLSNATLAGQNVCTQGRRTAWIKAHPILVEAVCKQCCV